MTGGVFICAHPFLNTQDTGIMSILTANNVSQVFGGFTVFTGVNVSIPHGAKIGMVGPNGIGKTTLLRILLVTHDRYLVDRLATQIWNLEEGYLNVFQGSYAEFVA
jgi:ATP-binding cassette subfamily F protein 3